MTNYLSGQSTILHHTVLAPGKASHGEWDQQALFSLLVSTQLPEPHLYLAGDPISQGFLPKWHSENNIAGWQICLVPLGLRYDFLNIQIKLSCLSPDLENSSEFDSQTVLFFLLPANDMWKWKFRSFRRNATFHISLIFFIEDKWNRDMAKHWSLLRSWLYLEVTSTGTRTLLMHEQGRTELWLVMDAVLLPMTSTTKPLQH